MKIGDLETDLIQSAAEALDAAYGRANGSIGGRLRVATRRERHHRKVQILDRGKLVFDATLYADGDQLVRVHKRGDWAARLQQAHQNMAPRSGHA